MVHLLWWSEVKIGIGDRPRWTVAHCPKRLQPQFQPDWNHSVRPKIEILLWSSLCESSKRRQKDLLGQLVHLISTLYKPQKKSAKQPTTLTFKVLSEPLFRPQKLFSWKNGLFFFHFLSTSFRLPKSWRLWSPFRSNRPAGLSVRDGWFTSRKWTKIPLERDHVKRMGVVFQPAIFRGVFTLVFGGVWYEKENMFCPKWDEKTSKQKTIFPTNYPNLQCEKKAGWVVLVNYFK